MYRVIIADDEPWASFRLTQLIDWAALGFEIIDTAINGIEAQEKCLALKPDLLLSDIRMPGMEGLELMQALRPKLKDLKIILVSGYAEFTYAQQALRLGAYDYLVKQVSKEQLTDVITRLASELQQSKMSFDTYFALLDDDSQMSINSWLPSELKVMEQKRFLFCTYDIMEGEYPDRVYVHDTQAFGQVILRTGRHKASALLYGDFISEWSSPEGYCGYSDVADGETPFVTLCRRSDIAYMTAKWLLKQEALYYTQASNALTNGLLSDLAQALRDGNDARCLQTLRALKQTAQGMMLDEIAELHNQLMHLFIRYNKLTSESFEQDYRSLPLEYASLGDMFEFFYQSLGGIPNEGEFVLTKIQQYITNNFKNDLRIADIAEQFHFTPGYLGTLFRKQTGQTLIKYITDKRIDYAKELLRNSDLSIQDIADRCGYSDYFQFNKAFKRNTNYTPGQFRKM